MSYDPAIPLLGIYPERTITEKDTCTLIFIGAFFIIARTWKQPRCPTTDEWIKNMRYTYTVEYYSVIKKNEVESVIQSEESQKNKSFSLVAIFLPMVSLSLFLPVVSMWFLFEGGEAVSQTFKLWLIVQNCDMKNK